MANQDVIDALGAELEEGQVELAEALAGIVTPDAPEPEVGANIQRYAEYLRRFANAAGMLCELVDQLESKSERRRPSERRLAANLGTCRGEVSRFIDVSHEAPDVTPCRASPPSPILCVCLARNA